jgi:hypothetical protein
MHQPATFIISNLFQTMASKNRRKSQSNIVVIKGQRIDLANGGKPVKQGKGKKVK